MNKSGTKWAMDVYDRRGVCFQTVGMSRQRTVKMIMQWAQHGGATEIIMKCKGKQWKMKRDDAVLFSEDTLDSILADLEGSKWYPAE